MRKKLNSALTALRGNKGSGLVLVLVCMICVATLGTLILCLSYTGFMIKSTDRQSKADLYSAETAMDEIGAGMQQLASDAISDAYKVALVDYSNDELNNNKAEEKFRTNFINNLKECKDDEGKSLFNFAAGSKNGTYENIVLSEFVTSSAVKVGTEATGAAVIGDKAITLKNVSVTYTHKGYTTSITTDIVVSSPDFNPIQSDGDVSELKSYALIADTALETGNTITNTVTGSVYAGAIKAKNELTMSGGTVICKGAADVEIGGIFTVNSNLWAGRITVGNGAELYLNSDTRVADDLELSGKDAEAHLSGHYTGFGDSTTDSGKSSAILVNKKKTTLDMSGLTSLVLVGHSFISDDIPNKETKTNDILMGESISVRGNQTAYIAPVSCLEGATQNPVVASAENLPTNVTLKSTPIVGEKTASEYGIKLVPVYANYPGAAQKIVYYFISFDATGEKTAVENANEFFKDYFAANKSTITNYLKQYTTLSSSGGSKQAAGYIIQKKADGSFDLENPTTYTSNYVSSMSEKFDNLTATLSMVVKGTGTPYAYFVNATEVKNVGTDRYFNLSGKTVGVVASGDYKINGTYSDLRVVIAGGNVTVSKNFTGLIISGGKITLGNAVTVQSDEAGVTAAFGAKYGDVKLSHYLLNGVSDSAETETGDTGIGWNLDKLISYKNWKKN